MNKKQTSSFNRTFMELKVDQPPGPPRGPPRFNRTFMELKALCPCLVKFGFLFQSHLYGIERAHRHPRGWLNLVSIAPLWNWKVWTRTRLVLAFSFNRTFMELKVVYCDIPYEGRTFQSHLYGIEREVNDTSMFRCRCFNRTFMELKGGKRRGLQVDKPVSIAPLWNWKETTRCAISV